MHICVLTLIVNNLRLKQQNKDGGWGLHIEGHSTMFGSVISYVALRLFGEGTNGGDGAMEKARDWILSHGSATAITSWGKMWLSVSAKLYHHCFILSPDIFNLFE